MLIPTTLDEAVVHLINELPKRDLRFLETDENAAVALHHNLGRQLRNAWGLWTDDSELRQWFKDNLDIGHPDDISAIVLEATQQKLRGRLYCPQATIRRFHKHWEAYGCNHHGEKHGS